MGRKSLGCKSFSCSGPFGSPYQEQPRGTVVNLQYFSQGSAQGVGARFTQPSTHPSEVRTGMENM